MKNARTIAFLGAIACSVALFAGCATDEAATANSDAATCSGAAACSGEKSCSGEKACCSEKAAGTCTDAAAKEAAKN